MKDDYSIDFTGAPQRSIEDREKVKQLMVDSFKVLAKSALLKKESEDVMLLVIAFYEKYKGKKPETCTWEEREKITTEADYLMDLWRGSIKKLKELDEEYEEVRKRVNDHYGKEIMPERKNPPWIQQMYNDILDEGNSDWWKKSS